ncbi:bacterial proteasome activator family protein [Angustibacter luteus]|uniref:Bacterial proteasome activator n=1 Tax=Angustibacter luteus TaxID=658456 RepID=A0ABW1JDT2_9ACTN
MSQPDETNPGPEQDRFVVVTQDGMGVSSSGSGSGDGTGEGEDAERNPADLIEQPAKVMRIGSMIKQLLEEVRSAPLDDAGRSRLAAIHERSLTELEQGLAPELVDELRRITLPFSGDQTPSDAELRIAQAQLVGWLEGLFHGIQTALMAQQMAARAQLEEMRRALPPGAMPPDGLPGHPQHPGQPQHPSQQPPNTGQYL